MHQNSTSSLEDWSTELFNHTDKAIIGVSLLVLFRVRGFMVWEEECESE